MYGIIKSKRKEEARFLCRLKAAVSARPFYKENVMARHRGRKMGGRCGKGFHLKTKGRGKGVKCVRSK